MAYPGNEPTVFGRSEVPRPMILRTCNRLHRRKLRYRRNLAQDAWNDNEEAPNERSWTAVVECQTDVAVRRLGARDFAIGGTQLT